MTWVFDEAVKWVVSIVGSVFDLFAKIFLKMFAIDCPFKKGFPIEFNKKSTFVKFLGYDFLSQIWIVVLYSAIAIVLIIAVTALMRNFGAIVTEEAENPLHIGVRTFLATLGVVWSTNIIRYAFVMFKHIYNAFAGGAKSSIDAKDVIFSTFIDGLEDANPVTSGPKLASSVLALILAIMAFINVLKLIIEAAERYVVANILIFFSPYGMAAIASKSTSKLFHSYLRMVFSQLLLMCFNIFFIYGGVSIMKRTPEDSVTIVRMIFLLAFLKCGQRIDSYMKSLGMDAVQTGGSLLEEAISTGKMIGSVFRTQMHNFGKGGMGSGIKRGLAQAGILGAGAFSAAENLDFDRRKVNNATDILSGGARGVAGSAAEMAAQAAKKGVYNPNSQFETAGSQILNGMGQNIKNNEALRNNASNQEIADAVANAMGDGKKSLNEILPNNFKNTDSKKLGVDREGNPILSYDIGSNEAGIISAHKPTGQNYQEIPNAIIGEDGQRKSGYLYRGGVMGSKGEKPLVTSMPKQGQKMDFMQAMGLQSNNSARGMVTKIAGLGSSGVEVAALGTTGQQMLGTMTGLQTSALAGSILRTNQDGSGILHTKDKEYALTADQMGEVVANSTQITGLEESGIGSVSWSGSGEEIGIIAQTGNDTLHIGGMGAAQPLSDNLLDQTGFIPSSTVEKEFATSNLDFGECMVSSGDKHYNAEEVAYAMSHNDNPVIEMSPSVRDGESGLQIDYSNGSSVFASDAFLSEKIGTDGLYIDQADVENYTEARQFHIGSDDVNAIVHSVYGSNVNGEDIHMTDFRTDKDTGIHHMTTNTGSHIGLVDATKYYGDTKGCRTVSLNGGTYYAVKERPMKDSDNFEIPQDRYHFRKLDGID